MNISKFLHSDHNFVITKKFGHGMDMLEECLILYPSDTVYGNVIAIMRVITAIICFIMDPIAFMILMELMVLIAAIATMAIMAIMVIMSVLEIICVQAVKAAKPKILFYLP